MVDRIDGEIEFVSVEIFHLKERQGKRERQREREGEREREREREREIERGR